MRNAAAASIIPDYRFKLLSVQAGLCYCVGLAVIA